VQKYGGPGAKCRLGGVGEKRERERCRNRSEVLVDISPLMLSFGHGSVRHVLLVLWMASCIFLYGGKIM